MNAPVSAPFIEAAAAEEYLALEIETLEEELKGSNTAPERWGLEKTIAGLKTARAFLTDEMLKRCTVTPIRARGRAS